MFIVLKRSPVVLGIYKENRNMLYASCILLLEELWNLLYISTFTAVSSVCLFEIAALFSVMWTDYMYIVHFLCSHWWWAFIFWLLQVVLVVSLLVNTFLCWWMSYVEYMYRFGVALFLICRKGVARSWCMHT